LAASSTRRTAGSKLAQIIPWHLIEEDYRSNFAASGMGAPAKESRIALGGKPLGCPREMTREEKRRQRQEEKDRIPTEGKFGNAKRKGTLQRVMAKLAVTSRTVVTIGLIALNLDALLRILRALIQSWCTSLVLIPGANEDQAPH